jgi:thiamin-phosphate kinase
VVTLGEHALVARIRQRLGPAPDWLIVDVGDDAAVYEPARNRLEVITTDAIVDLVHFDRRFVPAEAIGHRAVAVNLSDLAAMGATPRLLTLSLALPDDVSLDDFDRLVDGAIGLAERAGARVVGGNITRTPGPLVVDVTAIGSVHRRRILRRSGARAGDYVFVSGTLGDARAGLALLADPGGADADTWPEVVARYLQPEPGYGWARPWDSRGPPRRPWISATGWPMGWRGSPRTTGSAARSTRPRCRSRRVPGRCGRRVAPMRWSKPWRAGTTTSWRSPSGRRKLAA